MKRVVATTLVVFACYGSVCALPVGNPAEPALMTEGVCWAGNPDDCSCCCSWCDSFSFRGGFYGDYVFNRHLEASTTPTTGIEYTQIYTNAAYLVLNFCDRIDFFSTLGMTKMNLDTHSDVFGPLRVLIETDSRFSWSVGARGILWECGCTTVGVEGQYFQTKPHVKKVVIAELISAFPDMALNYREGQVGVGIAHRIGIFEPYIAAKWSRARVSTVSSDFLNSNALRNSKSWGYAVGVSLVDCDRFSVTAEGRFAAENAFYVNAQVRL